VDVNARDVRGSDPFLRASETGDADGVRHNADAHERDNSGTSHCIWRLQGRASRLFK
jgi:hypothetical protein